MRPIARQSSILLIVVTAVAYFVAGKLALLLAIPPGYATAVWPAAGVALAAVLLAGYRVSIGVVIGSFLVNLGMGVDSSSLGAMAQSLIVPFVIGCGAGLQAVAGGWLVRTFISSQLRLDSLGEVSRFIALAVIISSVINASVGSGTLLLADIMAPDNFLFNWVTWWTGDAIGILIFTVLILTYLAPEEDVWRPRRLTIAIPLILCFISVVTLFILSSRWEVNNHKHIFEHKAEVIYSRLHAATRVPRNVLNTFAGFYLSSDFVDRDEFSSFSEIILEGNASIQALGWVPRVPHAKRAEYEKRAREEGFSNFVFTEITEDGLGPAKQRAEYFPVYYVEPLAGNEVALGLDLGANESRRVAIDLAESTGDFTTTESIKLVQEKENQRAVIMLMPVYEKGQTGMVQGFVEVVYRVTDLVESVITAGEMEGVVLTITETNDEGMASELLSSTSIWPDVPGNEVGDLLFQKSLDVGNREWMMTVVANQELLSKSRTLVPWALLAGGLLFSGLLGAFLLYVTGETYRARKTADQLRATLESLRVTQTQLVESEKLASLGGMMSGLAHELSTPVGIAVTAVSTLGDRVKILRRKAEADELTRSDLDSFLDVSAEAAEITQGNLNRASQLVNSFKEVSVDRATDDIRKICLAEYLDEILIYMRPSYKRTGHRIDLECDEKISITTMPGGLSQVIINLLNNSLMHAFAEGQSGHILIHAEVIDGMVHLSYKDDGCGIPADKVDKVFERFYTTRKGSGGTGLGLHLVHEIVTQKLKGSIQLTQGQEPGVHFEIVLPVDITAGAKS